MTELTLREHIGAVINESLVEINAIVQETAVCVFVILAIWVLP